MSVLSALVSGLVVSSTAGALALDHEFYRRTTEWSDRSVFGGPGDRRSVALTFDDGPSPQTVDLLAYLDREQIPATFFQLGVQLERYPALAQQVQAHGHELGNHGWSHTRLSPFYDGRLHVPSPRTMHRELARTQQLMTELYGQSPHFFRPPYGARWLGLEMVQRSLGLVGVQWTVIAHDYEWTAERIAQHVLARIVPGAIICMHDGRDTAPAPDITETLKGLEILVPALRAQGYTFETVGQILQPLTEQRAHAESGNDSTLRPEKHSVAVSAAAINQQH